MKLRQHNLYREQCTRLRQHKRCRTPQAPPSPQPSPASGRGCQAAAQLLRFLRQRRNRRTLMQLLHFFRQRKNRHAFMELLRFCHQRRKRQALMQIRRLFRRRRKLQVPMQFLRLSRQQIRRKATTPLRAELKFNHVRFGFCIALFHCAALPRRSSPVPSASRAAGGMAAIRAATITWCARAAVSGRGPICRPAKIKAGCCTAGLRDERPRQKNLAASFRSSHTHRRQSARSRRAVATRAAAHDEKRGDAGTTAEKSIGIAENSSDIARTPRTQCDRAG